MNRLSIKFLFGIFFIYFTGISQKKIYTTQFISETISIDGVFDEEIWKTASIAKNFVKYDPDNGKPEADYCKTEVKIAYSNEAIYVAATLYDSEPNKILKEISNRDAEAVADQFGIFFNGFNDGQQEFRFYVTAAGVQKDYLYTNDNVEDGSWDAIWASKVKISAIGWTVEMKIPYAALRFSSEKKQTWGLNLFREFRRERQYYTWNLIDTKIPTEATQAGQLEGIENIEPPTRLFFIPYSSMYLNTNEYQKTKSEFKVGLDIKYGINDAFTLDAILIPDFGQTAFDKVELNLTAFEQQFAENRPFFTEGTELFSKGNLFYSRRIGGEPSTTPELNNNEVFTKNPSKVNLLNAIKISGRTKDGLGVGFLNAITEKTMASINNEITGENRTAVSEPLANYNILVVDKRFNQNSSVSLINTNVTRNGEFRDANVTGLIWDLRNKNNSFQIQGNHNYSTVNDTEDKSGTKSYIEFNETAGKYRFGVGGEYVSDKFDPNDMGINFLTHYHALYGNFSYRILNPTKHFNKFSIFNTTYSEFDNRTGRVQEFTFETNINTTSRKNDYLGYGISFRPVEVSDFYEPRSFNETRFLTLPKYFNSYIYFSSNFNRKFAIDLNPSVTIFNEDKRATYSMSIMPRYRFSDKFSLIYDFFIRAQKNDIGFVSNVDTNSSDISMGRRDRTTFNNTITSKFSLNNVMNLNLSLRHYLSHATYNRISILQNDGSLVTNGFNLEEYNRNYNTWNLDLSYTWWFAPGSQVSVLYRNNSVTEEDKFTGVDNRFESNIKKSLNHQNLDHIFSISVRYFIDYNSTKNWSSKK
jgi:hypothetical protein